MYLKFFGLSQTPFSDVDTSSPFWTPKRQELVTLFRQAIVEQQGMTVLTGEEGSGKTTFVRAVFASVTDQPLKIISLSSEKLSFPLALTTVIRELGGEVESPSAAAEVPTPEKPVHPMAPLEEIAPLLRLLHNMLLARHAQQGGTVVLVIDNAHNLPVKALKDFHWLSMLETPEGKLLQTIFVGNATLSLKLEMPQLQLLKQRIIVHGELAPLSFEESFVYLLARLRVKSAVSSSPLFSVEALRLLARHGKGNPRTINTLANAALRLGATRRQKPISGPLMLEVIGEFRTLPKINHAGARRQLMRPLIQHRRATPLPNARQIWAAGIGAGTAALVLFSSQNALNNSTALLPNLTRVLRNDTVAQAAPETEASPPAPPTLPTPSLSPQNKGSAQSLRLKADEKKRRKQRKKQEKAQSKTAPSPQSSRRGGIQPEKTERRLSGSPPADDAKQEPDPTEVSLPGKILYRIPRDPASNRDRLFDN